MMDEETLQGDDVDVSAGVTLADAVDADGEWDGVETEPADDGDEPIDEADGGEQVAPGGVIVENVANLDTTVAVKKEERVIITVIDGEPVVTGVVGGGDNMQGDIDSAKDVTDQLRDLAAQAGKAVSEIIEDAAKAKTAAGSALFSLSDVQKVVDSLTWIEEHGHYLLTTDSAVDPTATYYELSGGVYELTSDTALDPFAQYYARSYDYVPTSDEEIDQEKAYYTRSGSGTELDPYAYAEVSQPDVAEIATYYERVGVYAPIPAADLDVSDIATYYERSGFARQAVTDPVAEGLGGYFVLAVDDSIRNYLATHLAMTERGLELLGDSNGYRATLTTQGLEIRDPDNKLVGLHGETVQLGSVDGIYFEASSTRLAFRTLDQDIAYFGLNSDGIWEMHIDTSYVDDMMRFGDYAFIKRGNGNLCLKWMG